MPSKQPEAPDSDDASEGEKSDGKETAHASRIAEQLAMADDEDEGDDVETEWTLTCLDCDFSMEITTEGHPHAGPPDVVEDRVTLHKHSTDESHVVRVAGRRADRDDRLDPSLITDGGFERLNAMERQAEALEDLVEQQRIQNAVLLEMVRTLDNRLAQCRDQRPAEPTTPRSGSNIAGWVEDAEFELDGRFGGDR